MNLPVYRGVVKYNGTVTLSTFSGHEHMLHAFIGNMQKEGIISDVLEGDAKIVQRKNVLKNDTVHGYIFDESFHSVALNIDAWKKDKKFIDNAISTMPQFVDAKHRKLKGPSAIIYLMQLLDNYVRDMPQKQFSQVAHNWLDKMYKLGYSSVRDALMPIGILDKLDFSNEFVKKHLHAIAVSPQCVFGTDKLNGLEQKLKQIKNKGYEVYIKMFGDGTFDARTVNIAYETQKTIEATTYLAKKVDVDGIIVHGLGEKGILNALKWIKYIRKKTEKPLLCGEVHHAQVYTPAISKIIVQMPNIKLCPQPNFYSSDYLGFSKKYSVFRKLQYLLPLKTMISDVGINNITIGTDDMPPHLSYLMASALFRQESQARLSPNEFLDILSNKSQNFNKITIDVERFCKELPTYEKRRQFLSEPYHPRVAKLNYEIVKLG